MSAQIKGSLHGLVNIAGNGAIFSLVPSPYKEYVLLAFNLISLILAFIDPSYTFQKFGRIDKK